MLQEAIIRQYTITAYLRKLEENAEKPFNWTVSLPDPHWRRVSAKDSEIYLHQAKQEARLADRELTRIKQKWQEAVRREEGQRDRRNLARCSDRVKHVITRRILTEAIHETLKAPPRMRKFKGRIMCPHCPPDNARPLTDACIATVIGPEAFEEYVMNRMECEVLQPSIPDAGELDTPPGLEVSL